MNGKEGALPDWEMLDTPPVIPVASNRCPSLFPVSYAHPLPETFNSHLPLPALALQTVSAGFMCGIGFRFCPHPSGRDRFLTDVSNQ